jgi:exopolyphosphatase / guanosine-5'-triphosphate,3'-diphosphate pyrophosphatase
LVKNCFAAIDMGTNSFHLIIVKIKNDGSFKIIDREKEICRLGSHKGKDLSFISPEEIETAISILLRFKKIAETYSAPIRAVATSAVREANNRIEFLNEVMEKTGIEVEVIDGKREAELIFKGVQKSIPVNDKKVLCVDLGGGSTEIIYGDHGRVIFTESMKIGAVRLSKKFFHDFVVNDVSVNNCFNYIEEEILRHREMNTKIDFDFAIGSSGTIQAISKIIHSQNHKAPTKPSNSFSFDSNQLNQIVDMILKAASIEDRLKIKGVEAKRADILPAGILILTKIFKLFDIKNMITSDYALREGVIIDSIEQRRFINDTSSHSTF